MYRPTVDSLTSILEHQQFVRGSTVLPRADSHGSSAYQLTDFAIDPGPSPAPPGLPAPEGAEPASMPAEHRLGFDDDQDVQHRREEPGQPIKDQTIDVSQAGPLRRLAAQNQQRFA